MRPLTLLTALLAAAQLWPATAWAQQGMAFTAPHGPMGVEERGTVSAKPRSDPTAREAPILPSGRLPNQAIGPRKDRVIRDICIGCWAMSVMARISGVLLDLSSVVFSGNEAIGDAVASVKDLRTNDIPLRFVTNTTSKPLRALLEKLHSLGIEASRDDIFTPATAARRLLQERGLSPHFLVHPDLLEDLDVPSARAPDAVIVGDAGQGFTFDALNAAFRLIDSGAAFTTLARNRTFRDSD